MLGLSSRATASADGEVRGTGWVCLGREAELRGNGPFAVSADGLDLVIVRAESGLRAYQGRCPHQGALLGEGEMDGTALVCRNHRWRFDAASGAREGGPGCLVSCSIETRGADLWVDVAPLRRAQGAASIARRRLEDLPGPKGLPLIARYLSTKGPFLVLRGIGLCLRSYLRRRMMNCSVRLLWRVLRPLVFWPHGVHG